MDKYSSKVWLFLVAVAFLAVSCAPRQPQVALAPFSAEDLNSKIRSGMLKQKAKNFIVVLDASGSMSENYKGQVKLDLARNFVARFNRTIPAIDVNGGLRRLGGTAHYASDTDLIYGIKPYRKPDLEGAIKTVALPVGETPLAKAIKGASEDMKSAQGPIAAIIVSDGNNTEGNALRAAQGMKKRFGDRLCIYTVVIGNDPDGREIMKEIAQEGRCGGTIREDATRTSLTMANFVENVFFARVGDQDGDGVLDPSDQCPNTPRGAQVDARGCPVPAQVTQAPRVMDSDGDGVLDDADKCPGTPAGAQVDSRGCWVLQNVRFDFDKWNIKPRYYPVLDEVVDVLKKNPSLKVQVQGHTDNKGTVTYNQKLSENRAKSVIKYLTRKGIAKQRLEPEGFGLTRPIATNNTPEGRYQNRRVQMKPLE